MNSSQSVSQPMLYRCIRVLSVICLILAIMIVADLPVMLYATVLQLNGGTGVLTVAPVLLCIAAMIVSLILDVVTFVLVICYKKKGYVVPVNKFLAFVIINFAVIAAPFLFYFVQRLPLFLSRAFF